jgi:hypothetical protein
LALTLLQALQAAPAVALQLVAERVWHVPLAYALQQPARQDVASQTQAPPAQRWPAPHTDPLMPHWQPITGAQLSALMPQAAPPRQVQAPLAEQPSALAPQLAHTAPVAAHWVTVRGETQVPLAVAVQQPDGHEVASQVHTPATQRCPVPVHAGFVPHRQPVPSAQLSAVVEHALHVPPAAGLQLVADSVRQVPFAYALQQPPGHELPSQTQAPATQR